MRPMRVGPRSAATLLAIVLFPAAEARGAEGTRTEGAPVSASGTLTWDGSLALAGANAGSTAGRALLDAGVDLDLDAWFGWRGVRAYVGVQALRGGPGGALAEEYQSHSDVDAPRFENVVGRVEAVFRGGFRVRAGVMDANDDFAFAEAADGFINASAGYSPSIVCLPTYPEPRPGVVGARDGRSWGAAVGIYDGDPHAVGDAEGTFGIAEVRRTHRTADGAETRVAVGLWRHRTRSSDVEPTDGAYLVAERAWALPARSGRVRAWFSAGTSTGPLAEVPGHGALGLAAEGALRSRPDDDFGVLVTRARLRPPATTDPGHETVVEVFHRFRVSEAVAIQPDLQWIDRPGATPGVPDGWIATIRAEFSF